MLNLIELSEQNPKTGKLLTLWTKKMLSNFQKMIVSDGKNPDLNKGLEIPEITDEMAKIALSGMVKVNFRLLYDFFDENGVFLYIAFDVAGAFINNFTDKDHNTRIEAEVEGFECSFKTLESKL